MSKINSPLTNIGVRHLKCAVAAARHRTFAAAAEDLGVAASALSETIKQIEEDTGVLLFDRAVRPPVLTEHGRRFISDAERILVQFGQAVQDMRDLGGVRTGHVRVAASPSMMSAVVIPAIARFRAAHPGVKVVAHQENAQIVEEMLLSGDADIGLHELWEKVDGVACEPFVSDRYGLACGPDHALAQRSSVRLDDVMGLDFISLTGETGIRKQLERNLPQYPAIWNSPVETSSTITLIWMLSCNAGVALMPELAVSIPSMSAVRFVPIEDVDIRRDMFLMARANRSATPAARAFSEVVRSVGAEVSAKLLAP